MTQYFEICSATNVPQRLKPPAFAGDHGMAKAIPLRTPGPLDPVSLNSHGPLNPVPLNSPGFFNNPVLLHNAVPLRDRGATL